MEVIERDKRRAGSTNATFLQDDFQMVNGNSRKSQPYTKSSGPASRSFAPSASSPGTSDAPEARTAADSTSDFFSTNIAPPSFNHSRAFEVKGSHRKLEPVSKKRSWVPDQDVNTTGSSHEDKTRVEEGPSSISRINRRLSSSILG